MRTIGYEESQAIGDYIKMKKPGFIACSVPTDVIPLLINEIAECRVIELIETTSGFFFNIEGTLFNKICEGWSLWSGKKLDIAERIRMYAQKRDAALPNSGIKD